MRQVIFCCELESGVYGWFVHEADAVLISLGLELLSGRREFAEVSEFWGTYQQRIPYTPRFEAIMAEPEEAYGWDEITTGHSLPFSEAVVHRASLLDLPNVGYLGAESPTTGPIFEVRGYPALQSLREALGEGFEVRVMDWMAEYTGEKNPEETLHMISTVRATEPGISTGAATGSGSGAANTTDEPDTTEGAARGAALALDFPFLFLDEDVAAAEERLRRNILPELLTDPGFTGLLILGMDGIRDRGRNCTELQILALWDGDPTGPEPKAPRVKESALRDLLHTELRDLLLKHQPPLRFEVTGWSLPPRTIPDLHATTLILPEASERLTDELLLPSAVTGFLSLREIDQTHPRPPQRSGHRLVLHGREVDRLLFARSLETLLRRTPTLLRSRNIERSEHRASFYRR